MSILDRALQREILQRLEQHFPKAVNVMENFDFAAFQTTQDKLNANLIYLSEHGLITAADISTLEHGYRLADPRITARGLDFLADDGGLTAIMGIVTVRVHEQTIKDVVAAWVAASALPDQQKNQYVSRLRALPADATKHLFLRLIDAGLENAPKALQLLQTLLGFPGGGA